MRPQPDDDYGLVLTGTPAEVVLEIGRHAGAAAARHLAEPENRAGLAGAVLLPLIVFRGRMPPLLLFVAVSLLGDQIGRTARRASANLEILARAAEQQ